ncbi:hypothetical protein FJZ26_02270 [Candidatus Parvarchaeota archaeon]|nr:hypothetical protein [Candidatus Parvarchaeota archaeon]
MDVFGKIILVEKPIAPGSLIGQINGILCELGESNGFTVIANQDVACEWIKDGEHVAIEIQFGNPEDHYKSLRKLSLSTARHCVLVISSKARSLSLLQAERLLRDRFSIGQKEFLIFDIETGKYLHVASQGTSHSLPCAPQNQGKQGQQTQSTQGQSSQGATIQKTGRGQGALQQSSFGRRPPRRKIIYGRKGEHKEQD